MRRKPRGPQRGFARVFIVLFVTFGLLIGGSMFGTVGGVLAGYAYIDQTLPEADVLEDIPISESSYVYDRSGQTLLTRFECENRESVAFEEVPEVIVDATVASEDRTFWTNPGVDFQGIGRAAIANLEAGGIVQGGSTITQQVIKYAGALEPLVAGVGCEQPVPDFQTVRTDEERIYSKLREQVMAMKVTQAYPGREGKERILETYLNLIYYGNRSYGIKAAAANYFGLTNLADMTLAQAAFLAALPQAPSELDPFQRREECAAREAEGRPLCTQEEDGSAPAVRERNLVLGAMLEEGYITQAEYDEAVATPMPFESFSRLSSVLLEPHFVYRVRQEAIDILAELGVEDPGRDVDVGGYRITTTIDYQLQQMAKAEVAEWVAALADKNVHNGALVSIDSRTGEILAYVGSVDFDNRDDERVKGEFDVAGLGERQPGSAFKPITYSAAFQLRRASPATLLVDAWTEFSTIGQTSYLPSNASVTEHGPVLATDALRMSLNVPSVKVQYLAGVQETADFAARMGITEDIMSTDPGLSLTLGSVPISLLEMTQAYSVFAQDGTLRPARTILEIRDRNDRVIYTRADNGPEASQPMSPAEAYLTNWILEGNTDPAKNPLWGPFAQLKDPQGARRPAGFKTGTTDNFKDVSGFGYVPDGLVTGVWMGNSNGESLSNELGEGLFSADGPLYLWQEFMEQALNGEWDWNGRAPAPTTQFQRPEGISDVTVCRWTGMAPNPGCIGGRTVIMPFLSDALPQFDTISARGCLDLVLYEQQSGNPQTWIDATRIWSDRLVNGDFAARGNPEAEGAKPGVDRFKIGPLPGESGFPSVCGQRRAPPPRPTPRPGASRPPSPQPTATPAPDDD